MNTGPFSEMLELFCQILGFRRLIVARRQGQPDAVVERLLEAVSIGPIYCWRLSLLGPSTAGGCLYWAHLLLEAVSIGPIYSYIGALLF